MVSAPARDKRKRTLPVVDVTWRRLRLVFELPKSEFWEVCLLPIGVRCCPGMAEHKRIPFETVKPKNNEKETRDLPPTFRFNLSLQESNEKTCPEFSYSELVKSAKKDEKKGGDSDVPFAGDGDDDQKLREIARKFEEKYGPKGESKKRKKMGRWEDYVDRGMGYDETDPFIDNGEAYDELVPSTLTTQFGGFYINSGELEFKTVSEDEAEGYHDGVKRRRRRRRRDSDDRDLKKKRTVIRDGGPGSRGRGRKPGMARSASALAKAKRKSQPTVALLLQERKALLLQQQQQAQEADHAERPQLIEIQEQQHPPIKESKKEVVEEPLLLAESPLPAPPISASEDEDLFQDFDQLPGSDDKSENNINDIIESVIKNNEDILGNGNLLMYAGGGSSDCDEVGLTIADVEAPKLPDNLSAGLNDMIRNIKQAAISSEQGKCKFFNHDVNNLLLNIELQTRELPCTKRSMVYSHLASYLPCRKETLLKRAKKLLLDQEDGKLLEPLQRLQKKIWEVLPAMIEKFNSACLSYRETKTDSKEVGAFGNEEDDDVSEESMVKEKKESKLPRKKFEWNESVRELLCEVVRIKLKCYEVSKTRTLSAEDYLLQFLDQDICKLWPPGWVNTKILLRESRSAHSYATNSRPLKKPALIVKKSLTPSQTDAMLQSLVAKYSNMPQTIMTQENQRTVETVTSSLPSITQLEELVEQPSVFSNVQDPLIPEERTLSLNKVGVFESNTVESNQHQVSVSSQSKKVFTAMTEEASKVVEDENSASKKVYPGNILDRIINASLADFPNSGLSTQSVTIERTPRPAKIETSQKQVHQHHQQQQSNSKSELLKSSTSHFMSETSKTSSSNYGSTPTVSILKSNFQSPPQPQQTPHQPQPRQNRGLEHVNYLPTLQAHSNKQVSPNSKSNSLNRPVHGSSLPVQSYEFQEAFKRSLNVSTNVSANSGELLSARNYPRKRQVSEESDEHPVNFSNSQSGVHFVSSQELNRLTSSALSPSFQPQSVVSTVPVRVPRSTSESTYNSAFAEGMKGFPLPLKTVGNPPPAHSYQSNCRTSPSRESGVVGAHHHSNSQSPHQMAVTSAHSPPQMVSSQSPFQSTAPLSHFATPDSTHNPCSIIQSTWRGPTASSTTASNSGFTIPSQYCTSSNSSTVNYMSQSASSMNHGLSGLGPLPGHHFLPAPAPTSAQRSHAKPYTSTIPSQSSQTQPSIHRGVYGQLYRPTSGYPATGTHGAAGVPFSESSLSHGVPQLLTNFHGVPVPSLSDPRQQGSHTRIP